MSQTPFVVINTSSDLTEAQIMKGLLEQNGIPAIIENENFSAVIPVLGAFQGVRLKVHEDDVASAHALLTNVQPIYVEEEPATTTTTECPACGSAEVFKYKSFFGWTIGRTHPDVKGNFRRCVSCDHRWRAAGDRKSNTFMIALILGACAYVIVWVLQWVINWLRYL